MTLNNIILNRQKRLMIKIEFLKSLRANNTNTKIIIFIIKPQSEDALKQKKKFIIGLEVGLMSLFFTNILTRKPFFCFNWILIKQILYTTS